MRPPSEEPVVVTPEEARELLSPPLGRRTLESRLSWGSVIAGVFIAIAVQLIFAALGTWAGFGIADIANIENLGDVATAVGLFIALPALISAFAGGFVASWLATSWTVGNGLWHGGVVWALSLVTTLLMSAYFGVTGVLGFATSPEAINRFFPTTPDVAAEEITATTATYSGWFLLGAIVALIAALVGGWVGTRNRGDVAGV